MRSQSLFTLLAVASAVVAENAPVVQSNPIGAQYEAVLTPKGQFTVAGAVKIASGAAGKGVSVEVSLAGLPTEFGPFLYHIHEKAVPEDGNCTGTGAHLDPYKRGETPPCDPSAKADCQVGDLSGKYGKVNGTTLSATYTDDFLATLTSDVSFFGDKSIVVHLANKTRIACANFKQLSPGDVATITSSVGTSYGTAVPSGSAGQGHNATASSTPTGSTGAPIQPTASPTANPSSTGTPPNTGAAGKVAVSGAALLAFAAAMML